ncbi:GNAT family N-acetyltransferase [Arthrobacter sp. CAN_A214]|uniref:GNAT family N-acetyltransferase n=1 Tax=Arthrobacter sp. CAN_A214 TaxID=2787720 RepID=UPI0018C949B8
MAEAGAAGRPQEVDDTSWHPAAQAAIASRITRGSLAAFVIDDEKSDVGENHGRALVLACAMVTLEDRLPGPGFPRGTSGSMSSVFVTPEHRGRGLARAVVSAGLSWLNEMGAEIVDLHATPDAERLYRSLGFSEARSLALRRVTHP